jgi:hypothetical protein
MRALTRHPRVTRSAALFLNSQVSLIESTGFELLTLRKSQFISNPGQKVHSILECTLIERTG